jgi:hypothetical protein
MPLYETRTECRTGAIEARSKGRASRYAWISIWAVLCLAPSIMLAGGSKFSPAVLMAVFYLIVRVIVRPLPSPGIPPMLAILGLSGYLLAHGAVLTLLSAKPVILMLQGQWVVYFLTGSLLAYDISQVADGESFLFRSYMSVAVISAAGGAISIFTGPFYQYANHVLARWGLPVDRAVGTFEAPAVLASVLSVGVLLLLFDSAGRLSSYRIALLLLMAIVLVLTQSKAGILCSFLAVFAGILLGGKCALDRRIVITLMAGLCGGVIAIAFVASTYSIDKYLTDSLGPQLLGIGYRQSAVRGPNGIWFTAHNSYVALLREIGAVGLGATGLFLWAVITRLRFGRFSKWGVALIAVMLMSYTETFLYDPHTVLLLGVVGGLSCRFSEQSDALASATPCLDPIPR